MSAASVTAKPDVVGVIPCAGLATRLRPFRYAKELLPIAYVVGEGAEEAAPIPVVGFSLAALSRAGVDRCVVVTSEAKPEVARCLGSGRDHGIQIAYVEQCQPLGLSDAVYAAHAWTRAAHTCLLLPDTVVRPVTAVASILKIVADEHCDLALGVFPTDHPEQLGPVKFTGDGRIEVVLEKPANSALRNTWGIAIWSPAFSDLVHERLGSGQQCGLHDLFNSAVAVGLRTRAVWFADGSYLDVGTRKGLFAVLSDEFAPSAEQQAVGAR